MPITPKVVRLKPVHDEVYSIQHYVIKFVSDLRQVGGFLRVLQSKSVKQDKQTRLRSPIPEGIEPQF
jgi:hypothetical protein